MSDDNLIQFPSKEKIEEKAKCPYTRSQMLKRIQDGMYIPQAYEWAFKTAIKTEYPAGINLMSLGKIITQYNLYLTFYFDAKKDVMLGMLWNLNEDTRTFRWISNFKELWTKDKGEVERLLRNGQYLYLLDKHPEVVELMGWKPVK